VAGRSIATKNGQESAGSFGLSEGIMNVLDLVEKEQLRTDLPAFKPGDTIKVHVKIKEGDKERIQVFEGICIAMKHGGVRATFTVRKISFGHGVERIFPMHSRVIDKVELVRSGRVRRAKLYYIRELRGKAARIREVKEVKETKAAIR
jgi:large subunit ribosomal protein L19